ncbi:MAG: transposase [Sterolibacterium sp.]
MGQLAYFIEFLNLTGLWSRWLEGCPLNYVSPNAPSKAEVLGTWLLSMLAGHRRYSHVTTIRCDGINPGLLGMRKVISEDALRNALKRIPEGEGIAWLDTHLADSVAPLLDAAWILDTDTTIKPLYGHQEGALIGYNPRKPGRPSHAYHTYLMAGLRQVLGVEVRAGNEHTAKHAQPGQLKILDALPPQRKPRLVRGDNAFGNDPLMMALEEREQPYLFKLKLSKNVKRHIGSLFRQSGWMDAGQGWEGLFIANASSTVGQALVPAGLEKSIGLITGAYTKGPTDPQWAKDPDMIEWKNWMAKYYPTGNNTDYFNVFGYMSAQLMTAVLKQAGDNLTRENILQQATSIRNMKSGMLLPGITMNTRVCSQLLKPDESASQANER